MLVQNEIVIFKPNSRKKEATIRSLIPRQAVDALGERLGKEAADKAHSAFKLMGRTDIDFMQLKLGDRRIRVKQIEA
jgi:hypothetical protein